MLYKRSFALSFFVIITMCLYLLCGCGKQKQTDISKINFNLPEINVVYNGQSQQFDINLGKFSNTYVMGEDYVLEYYNNINVGEGYVLIKAVEGSTKLKGEQKVKFNIVPLDLQDENISVECEDVVFNGNESTLPNVTLKYYDNIIPQSDYTVSLNEGSGAVNSQSSITISATQNGNLKNSLTASYNVVYCPLSATTITIAEATYSGQAQEPNVTIKIGENTVLDSIMNNLTLTYSNNINAGKAQLTIAVNEQNSHFEMGDSITLEFDILPADLAEFSVTVNNIGEVDYNGQPHKIVPTLNDSTNCLTVNDYVVKYYRNETEITNDEDFVDGGYIDIKIIGKNNFCGELNTRYFIRGIDISNDENLVISYEPSFEYTGQEIEPNVVVLYNNTEISNYELSYSKNIGAGTAQIIIDFYGNYFCTVTKEFTITPKSISGLTFNLVETTTVWRPQGAVVEVSLFDDGKELVLGEDNDYKLTYTDNGSVGTATVKATGLGNYTGQTEELSYTITALDIQNCSLKDFNTELEYTGSGQQQPVALVYSKELASGTDIDSSNFDVTYYKDEQLTQEMQVSEMVDVGTVIYIKIVGKNNLTGNLKASYTIVPFNLTNQNTTITLDENEFIFNGEAFEPEVTQVEVDGFGELDFYSVSYSNNTNAGTANVIISGTGNFSGAATQTFTIAPKALEQACINWAEDSDYDGEVHEVIPTFSDNLITENDYDILCYKEIDGEQVPITGNALHNITDGGNYIVTVIAKNNFTGTFSHTTKILQQENYFTNDLEMQSWVYGDDPKEPNITAKYGTPIFRYKSQNSGWSFEAPINVGTYYVQAVITETVNYTGLVSEQVEFNITQNGDEDIEITVENAIYTGNIQSAKITFLNGNFVQGVDYNLTYYKNYEQRVLATEEDLTNVGELYVLLTPIGEQPFDEQVLQFSITKAQNEWLSELEICDYIYGQSITKPVVLSKFGEVVVQFKSYDDINEVWGDWQVWTDENKPVDAQTHMVQAIVAETANYAGLVGEQVEFNIVQSEDIDIIAENIAYTGEVQSAKIAFSIGNFTENVDYTLTYYTTYPDEEAEEATEEDLTNVGELYVLITPIGEQPFAEQVLTFSITKAQNEWLSELEVFGCEFGQSVTKPVVSSKFGEADIYFKSYDDYENVWSDWQVWTDENKPTDAQKYMAKAVVTGTENYYELQTYFVEFRITPQKLTLDHLTYTYNGTAYTSTSAVYNGQVQGLDFVVTDKNGNTISLNNFIVRVLKDGVPTHVIRDVGTYTYKISGKQNYIFVDENGDEISEVEVEFVINPAE